MNPFVSQVEVCLTPSEAPPVNAGNVGFEPTVFAVTRRHPLRAGPISVIIRASCRNRTDPSWVEARHTTEILMAQKLRSQESNLGRRVYETRKLPLLHLALKRLFPFRSLTGTTYTGRASITASQCAWSDQILSATY
jgi:hypothetical protein